MSDIASAGDISKGLSLIRSVALIVIMLVLGALVAQNVNLKKADLEHAAAIEAQEESIAALKKKVLQMELEIDVVSKLLAGQILGLLKEHHDEDRQNDEAGATVRPEE